MCLKAKSLKKCTWEGGVEHAVPAGCLLAVVAPSNGEPSLTSYPPRWISLDCKGPPPLGMVKQALFVKGDWCEYAATLGLPTWADGLKPCYRRNVSLSDLRPCVVKVCRVLRRHAREPSQFWRDCITTSAQQRTVFASEGS